MQNQAARISQQTQQQYIAHQPQQQQKPAPALSSKVVRIDK